ncbi:hypothetical protein ACU4GA_03820 [Methylobacterium oryzae CBMB20]
MPVPTWTEAPLPRPRLARGRDPSGHFSTDGYLDANPDVRVAGINPLVHFLEVGFAEGRTGWQKAHTHPTRYRGVGPAT